MSAALLAAPFAFAVSTAVLVEGKNVDLVRAHCTPCHSAALITQNRMSRDAWLETIRWMQKKQGLWPLGEHEAPILDYLEQYYKPVHQGRRKPLAPELMPGS